MKFVLPKNRNDLKKIVSLRVSVRTSPIYLMLVNPANITEKKYKKLSIKAALTGFVYCISDTLNPAILSFNEIAFDTSDKSKSTEDLYATAFENTEELNDRYDEIVILHDNNLATFVPTALFDEQYLGSYLQYNTKVFETDFYAFDDIATYQMNTVYIPYVNINNFLLDQFGTFVYRHAHTVLVSKLLDISKNIDEKKVFVHMAQGHFEIIVVQNQHLLLFNSFEYKTPEDLIYYLLFTAEQLNLNPETLKLEFLGDITEDDAFFNIAYKYIRNVSLFDVADFQQHNNFSTGENREYFILFQS